MIHATLYLALLLAPAAETPAPTQLPPLAPAALPTASYREALQQLDDDSLSAAQITEKLAQIAKRQLPACREELHRQISTCRHPSRFLPLLRAFPAATSFRLVLPYYLARPEDFGELLKSTLADDCAEAIEEQDLAPYKDFLELLGTNEETLVRWLATKALSHPEGGPLWRLPELRQVYAEAAKTGDVAALFLPEFPASLHRTLHKELNLDPASPLGLAALARSLGADWAQYLYGTDLWQAAACGDAAATLAAWQEVFARSGNNSSWNEVGRRIFARLPPQKQCELIRSSELFPSLTYTDLFAILRSGDRELLISCQQHHALSGSPAWFQQRLALLLADTAPALFPEKAPEFSDEQFAAWGALPVAELMLELQKLPPAQRQYACDRHDFEQLKAKDLIELLGPKLASQRRLTDISIADLTQLLATPSFSLDSAHDFDARDAAAIEDLLLHTSNKVLRYDCLDRLDLVRKPDAASILKRLRLGQPCTQLWPEEEVLQSLLATLETQPLDLPTLRLAHFLLDNLPSNEEGEICLPKAFLDRLETAAPQLAGEATVFALALLNQQRPQSMHIRPLLRQLLLTRRLELADPAFLSDWDISPWELIPKNLQLAEDEATALRQILRLAPEADLADFAALLPQSPAEDAEEALQFVTAFDLLRQHQPLAPARQDELRQSSGAWALARLVASLGPEEAKEIYQLLMNKPEQLALLQQRPDWPQLRQTWEQSLHPYDLKQAQTLAQLGCRLSQAIWVNLLPQVHNESELLLLLRLASNQPPLAPELEAALSEALEHSRNEDFFFLHQRPTEMACFTWPDPAADAQDKRLWDLKCRLNMKTWLRPFKPVFTTPAKNELSPLVSRWLAAPIQLFPELRAELFRVCSKLTASRILVRVIGETDDPRRLRALLKELPAELKSSCAWPAYDYPYEVLLDLRALSFWVATGIIPEDEVPTWLRPHLSSLIFSKTAAESSSGRLLRENGPRRLPEWSIAGDRIVFSPAAPAGYPSGSLETLWPFLPYSLRNSLLAKVKDETLRTRLETLPLRPPPPELNVSADDPEEAKAPLLPPPPPTMASGYFSVMGSLHFQLNAADEELWRLALDGDVSAAARLVESTIREPDEWIKDNSKLERCPGYRALDDACEHPLRLPEPWQQRLPALRTAFLDECLALGALNLSSWWDRHEIITHTDLMKNFERLLPFLEPRDLYGVPLDLWLTLLRHPHFPKAWLESKAVVSRAWHEIKESNQNPQMIDQLLALGIPVKGLIHSSHSDAVDALLSHLLKTGRLPSDDQRIRKRLFDLLFRSRDETLWKLAVDQGFRWSLPSRDQVIDWNEPRFQDKPKDLHEWLLLQRHMGLDLSQDPLLEQVLEQPLPEDGKDAARAFLKEHAAALKRPGKWGRTPLFYCHTDWLALLLAAGVDPRQRSESGDTALAWKRYSAEATRLLLAAGADARVLDQDGHGPLWDANAQAAQLLLAAGADPKQIDKEGRSLLWAAPVDSLALLVKAGADPEHLDPMGCNVLFGQFDLELLAALIAAGCDPHQRSPDGLKTIWNQAHGPRPPLPSPENIILNEAIDGLQHKEEQLLPWMETLLKSGADPALADAEGRTPLMLFARAGNPLLVRRLLAEGAKARPAALDRNGHNALDAIFLLPPEREEHLNNNDNDRLLCAKMLQQAGVKLTIKAPAPGVSTGLLWTRWQKQQAKSEDEQRAELLSEVLPYRDAAFSRAWLLAQPSPDTLATCVAACEWTLALELINKHPELIQPGSAATQELLATLAAKRQATAPTRSGCCVYQNSGRRQAEFDAFEESVKKLSAPPLP